MTRNARRGGKIWVRIFPDKPLTIKSAETRMGSGKGSFHYWVAVVKSDNSGTRKLMCIRIIGVSNRQYARIRDVIVAVVKKAKPSKHLERSEVIRAERYDVVLHGSCWEIGLRLKNRRSSSRKSARQIPKGVIHIQAGFHNTIMTVTDVVSCDSAGTCGFKGAKRGTPFAAQTVAGSAIRTLVKQGMQEVEVKIKGSGSGRDGALRAIRRSGILVSFVLDVTPMPHNGCRPPKKDNITTIREKIRVFTRTLQWKCDESRTDSKCLHYGRFILSPLMKGIQESVHEILMNLKEIVLRSNLYGTCEASICVRGPRCVTAQDIILPPYVEIVDNTQHIAGLTEPIDLCIGLQLERNRGYRIKAANNFQDGSYPIDALFMPVRNVNHSIHSYGNEKQEILFLEIWTNGSLTPKEALYKASRNLIDLFIPFLHAEEKNLHLEDNQHKVLLSLFTFHNRLAELKLLPRIYNCLKKSNIHTLLDLLNKSHEDLIKIEHFRIEDAKQILDTLEKHFAID
ncbi:hypothetical protein Cgig2_019502 [Carnegiea gigantea]|uniref:DNA-directed RNA polymerase n=1 Tax=Carnegiea gigantea TaxID=171969 RepID=A0A9Q1QLX2_9CARY|nr:hypothetical protein Cgig2_019502 [Carnegiea gigantea]